LKALRSDLEFVDIRGNIQTRFRKHDERQCDAMVLAAAGLLRLSLHDRIAEFLSIEVSTPAVGQGALAIECLTDNAWMRELLAAVDDLDVRAQSTAERAFLDQLGGGCSVPIGGLAQTTAPGRLKLIGCVAALDGSKVMRASLEGASDDAASIGKALAAKIAEMGAESVLSALRQSQPNAISAP
jgi:hydroxymethylbilane synthase